MKKIECIKVELIKYGKLLREKDIKIELAIDKGPHTVCWFEYDIFNVVCYLKLQPSETLNVFIH